MKKSKNLFIALAAVAGLVIGFMVGIAINFPKTQNSEIVGTIGRVDNYRNVKVSDSDIKLRSELLTNNMMLKQYQRYLSFHYASSEKICNNLESAIDASKAIIDFSEIHSTEIDAVSKYKQNLELAQKDILMALVSIQNLSESNEGNLGSLINNANVAIAQIRYREQVLSNFVEAIVSFMENNNPDDFPKLKKAHDLLTLDQITVAVATNNKPMIKYLDQKDFYSSSIVSMSDVQKNIGSNTQSILDSFSNDYPKLVNADAAKALTATLTGAFNDIITIVGDVASIMQSQVSAMQSDKLTFNSDIIMQDAIMQDAIMQDAIMQDAIMQDAINANY